ncbi:PIN domain-containing protein [Horticoccus luteus]|uniref:Ribonuclease VapC n=1 Tax=Horticoccus luteus TaxID=2862869 RepID=A0A8F9TR86_9BACT|nr:PIN domain-containing protein [Horticoccus luteus]QYM77506.1 PIN domain-containing protein [Horticoccus luteus]
MKYLLDVNALLAWEHSDSSHHAAFHTWAKQAGRSHLWTCAHTELGFLRVSMQVFGYSLAQASEALSLLKEHVGGFIAVAPSPRLPRWASTAVKTSDAYLTQLARENGLRLATFDAGIKDDAVELIGQPAREGSR